MQILHVITGLHKAAGTSVFCGEVANEFVSMGHDVTIAVVDPLDSDVYPLDSRIKLVSIKTILHSSTSTLNFDLVHIHALWTPILTQVAKWARVLQVSVVWSPHGMLTPWAMKNKCLKKFMGWWLYQRAALKHAALLHATAQSEVEDIRRMGLKNPVTVAPLGVRISRVSSFAKATEDKEERKSKTLLFVSRVQRKKGLPNLLDAWSRLSRELTDGWTIRIVGPDQDNHTVELMTQCAQLGLSYTDQEGRLHSAPTSNVCTSTRPVVEFAGPKYGEDLTREYASADLFVLPTHSENFGSVVIESLAQGVPVICTKEAPWSELETHKCGWWIDDNVEALVDAIKDGIASLEDGTSKEMGRRGLELVRSEYEWGTIAHILLSGYASITQGCEKGRCVSCPELYDTCSP